MGFFPRKAVLALYGLLGYFLLRFYVLALFGEHVEGSVVGELPYAAGLVVATVAAGSLVSWKPALRAHLFLVGIALSALVYALTWALLLAAGLLGVGPLAQVGAVDQGGRVELLRAILVGYVLLTPIGLPLGWGLVLVSQRQADGWSTRRRARELQA